MSTTTPSTSLTAATAEMRAGLLSQVGEEIISVYDRDAEALGAGATFADALDVGDRAPGFRLPDAGGGEVALDDLLVEGPVVLVFYRGGWCPYCNLQLAAFQSRLADIRAAGAQLVAVSPQTPDQSLTVAERHGLEFPVLSDAGNAVARDYGLVFTQGEAATATSRGLGIELADFNGDDSNTLPAASTFVIGKDGVVRFASVSGDYRWRVGPDEVLAALR
ncbi:MAG TPA: peroxiredoxin-like family protein [Solirubrobacteraceae bacterium]